jgi:hypothetical protein
MIGQEALDAARKAIAEGDEIVRRTHADQGIAVHDDDGPMMRAFLKQRATGAAVQPPPPPGELIEKIAYVVEAERTGRWITASMGLARLRELHESINPDDLAADERTWDGFAAKHIALPTERVRELIGKMVHSGGTIRCTRCSAGSISTCGCGVPYVSAHRWHETLEASAPKVESAFERAVAAIVADPKKSNRTIAAEIGVGKETVRRARASLENEPVHGPANGPLAKNMETRP